MLFLLAGVYQVSSKEDANHLHVFEEQAAHLYRKHPSLRV